MEIITILKTRCACGNYLEVEVPRDLEAEIQEEVILQELFPYE